MNKKVTVEVSPGITPYFVISIFNYLEYTISRDDIKENAKNKNIVVLERWL